MAYKINNSFNNYYYNNCGRNNSLNKINSSKINLILLINWGTLWIILQIIVWVTTTIIKFLP